MHPLRKAVFAASLLASLLTPLVAFAQAPPPVPALPDTERRTSYSITASTCACSVGFALLADSTDVDNWIQVSVNGVRRLSTDGTYGWALTSPTGPLATIPRPITDAVLTFATAQTATIQIVGASRPRRLSQFSENRGVAARDLNVAVTNAEAQLREAWDLRSRTMLGEAGFVFNPLPIAANRANMGLCWDSTGQPSTCANLPGTTMIAGSGIAFTGLGPTTLSADIAAGNGITFTGTHPLTVSAAYPWIDVGTFGAIGDGTTNNNTALQNAFTAAANGGNIRFPCGTFKVTAGLTLAIAEAKHVTIQGSGTDCTILLVSGTEGPVINYGGFNSSFAIKDMSIVTDAGGTHVGLTLNQSHATNNPAANIVNNGINNVLFRGDDAASSGAQLHYWGTALGSHGVTNLAITDVYIRGRTTTGLDSFGRGIFLEGWTTNQYSTTINITNTSMNFLDKGLVIGDWIQGISLVSDNLLGNTGIDIQPAVGLEDGGVQITNTQFNTFVCGICIRDVQFTGFEISNSGFIVEPNSTAISLAGTAQFAIIGNTFGALNTTATGVHFTGAFGQGGTVANNVFVTFGAAIKIDAGVNVGAMISNNQMVNNTTDYSIGAAGGSLIVDAIPHNFAALPACTAQTIYSRMLVVDPNPDPAYKAGVTAGGGALNPIPIVCDGATWHAH